MILKTFLEILMIGCGTVTLIGVVIGIREWWLLRKIAELPLESFPIKKTTFCQLVVDWCHENISHSNTRKPYVTLSYYPHRKWNGLYSSIGHECIIYVNNHQNVLNVINTVIHEYVHARQKNKGFDSLYERYQNELGYERNPYEVEARELARRYQKDCLLWVCQQI